MANKHRALTCTPGILLSLPCGLPRSSSPQTSRNLCFPYLWLTVMVALILYPSFVHALCGVTAPFLSLKTQALFPQSVNLDQPHGLLWPTECRPDMAPVLRLGLRRPHVVLPAHRRTPAVATRTHPGEPAEEVSHPDPLCQSQPRPAKPQTFEKPSQSNQSCPGAHRLTLHASAITAHWGRPRRFSDWSLHSVTVAAETGAPFINRKTEAQRWQLTHPNW